MYLNDAFDTVSCDISHEWTKEIKFTWKWRKM